MCDQERRRDAHLQDADDTQAVACGEEFASDGTSVEPRVAALT
jgi:hypothetical protein